MRTSSNLDALWNPRPHADLTDRSRRAYMDGYSDGFYRHPFDSGLHGAFSDYRSGYSDAARDVALWCEASGSQA